MIQLHAIRAFLALWTRAIEVSKKLSPTTWKLLTAIQCGLLMLSIWGFNASHRTPGESNPPAETNPAPNTSPGETRRVNVQNVQAVYFTTEDGYSVFHLQMHGSNFNPGYGAIIAVNGGNHHALYAHPQPRILL